MNIFNKERYNMSKYYELIDDSEYMNILNNSNN